MTRHPFRLAAIGLAGALALGSAAPIAAADDAMVRVLHASPDAPAVDVFLDDAKVDALTNVPFGTISGYLAIPAGDHTIRVCANADNSVCPIPDTNVALVAGQHYTIAATNALASIEAQVITDDPAPVTGRTQVRVVHFSADAPAVDVAPDGAAAIVEALAYPDPTAYLTLDPATYDLEVRLAGTMTVALDIDPIALEDGRSYSVFAIGSAASPAVGGNALQVVAAVDAIAAPATDATGSATSSTGFPVAALLLALMAAVAFVRVLRFDPAAPRR